LRNNSIHTVLCKALTENATEITYYNALIFHSCCEMHAAYYIIFGS